MINYDNIYDEVITLYSNFPNYIFYLYTYHEMQITRIPFYDNGLKKDLQNELGKLMGHFGM